MCEVTPDCDGRMVQGKCTDCGAFPSADDPPTWSGGAGARRGVPDETYRRQMRKIRERSTGDD